MNLPPTFFYKFFRENTLFIVDNTIYNPKLQFEDKDFLPIGKKKFGLRKGLKLSDLEKVYFSNNESELKEYGDGLLQNILSGEKEVSKDYHRLSEEIELVEFVLHGLLKRKKTEHNPKGLTVQEKNLYLIDKLFNQDYFVWKGKFYLLNKEKKDIFCVRINNKDYNIGDSSELNLKKLENEYVKIIEEKIYNQTTKGQDSLLSKIRKLKEKKDMVGLIKKGEFFNAKENIGFKKDSEGFFVTTKVYPYVLYEPRNKRYYKFNKALIGIKLAKKNRKISWQEPSVINSYIHPALPSAKPKPYQKICNGYFNYTQASKKKNIEDSIRMILAEARRMLTSGYFGEKGAWHFLDEKPFQKLEVKEFNPREVTNK